MGRSEETRGLCQSLVRSFTNWPRGNGAYRSKGRELRGDLAPARGPGCEACWLQQLLQTEDERRPGGWPPTETECPYRNADCRRNDHLQGDWQLPTEVCRPAQFWPVTLPGPSIQKDIPGPIGHQRPDHRSDPEATQTPHPLLQEWKDPVIRVTRLDWPVSLPQEERGDPLVRVRAFCGNQKLGEGPNDIRFERGQPARVTSGKVDPVPCQFRGRWKIPPIRTRRAHLQWQWSSRFLLFLWREFIKEPSQRTGQPSTSTIRLPPEGAEGRTSCRGWDLWSSESNWHSPVIWDWLRPTRLWLPPAWSPWPNLRPEPAQPSDSSSTTSWPSPGGRGPVEDPAKEPRRPMRCLRFMRM